MADYDLFLPHPSSVTTSQLLWQQILANLPSSSGRYPRADLAVDKGKALLDAAGFNCATPYDEMKAALIKYYTEEWDTQETAPRHMSPAFINFQHVRQMLDSIEAYGSHEKYGKAEVMRWCWAVENSANTLKEMTAAREWTTSWSRDQRLIARHYKHNTFNQKKWNANSRAVQSEVQWYTKFDKGMQWMKDCEDKETDYLDYMHCKHGGYEQMLDAEGNCPKEDKAPDTSGVLRKVGLNCWNLDALYEACEAKNTKMNGTIHGDLDQQLNNYKGIVHTACEMSGGRSDASGNILYIFPVFTGSWPTFMFGARGNHIKGYATKLFFPPDLEQITTGIEVGLLSMYNNPKNFKDKGPHYKKISTSVKPFNWKTGTWEPARGNWDTGSGCIDLRNQNGWSEASPHGEGCVYKDCTKSMGGDLKHHTPINGKYGNNDLDYIEWIPEALDSCIDRNSPDCKNKPYVEPSFAWIMGHMAANQAKVAYNHLLRKEMIDLMHWENSKYNSEAEWVAGALEHAPYLKAQECNIDGNVTSIPGYPITSQKEFYAVQSKYIKTMTFTRGYAWMKHGVLGNAEESQKRVDENNCFRLWFWPAVTGDYGEYYKIKDAEGDSLCFETKNNGTNCIMNTSLKVHPDDPEDFATSMSHEHPYMYTRGNLWQKLGYERHVVHEIAEAYQYAGMSTHSNAGFCVTVSKLIGSIDMLEKGVSIILIVSIVGILVVVTAIASKDMLIQLTHKMKESWKSKKAQQKKTKKGKETKDGFMTVNRKKVATSVTTLNAIDETGSRASRASSHASRQ